MRTTARINQDWFFRLDSEKDYSSQNAELNGFRRLTLPHDWSVDYAPEKEEPTGGGGGFGKSGIGWYLKEIEFDEIGEEEKLFLYFEGIYMNSTVYVNGHEAGGHGYGYSSFYTDITAFAKAGINRVAVRVDNSLVPNSRWYSGSGIYRDVYLVRTEALHFAHFGLRVATNGIYPEQNAAALQIQAAVVNETASPAAVGIRHRLFDADGSCVSVSGIALSLGAGEQSDCMTRPTVEAPILWTDDEPYLYTIVSELLLDGEVIDCIETKTGIRTATFDSDRGFLLNGKTVKIKGMCVHHDGGLTGAAFYRETWERRLRKLKDMGCNGIRTAHNPPAPELLDLCDELGFLVMDEAFDEWLLAKNKTDNYYSEQLAYGSSLFFTNHAEEDLVTMIRRDYNHPSVVLWSIGNEIPEQSSIDGVKILEFLQNICHREDTSRMVTSACDNIAAVEPIRTLPEFENALDVVGYNYVGRWRKRAETFYEEDRAAYPKRRFIGTENPSAGGVRGDYSGEGRFGSYANVSMGHEALWRYTASHDFVSGDYLWTGIDYLGETRWPSRGAGSGPLDTAAFEKDSFYYFRSIWNSKDVTLHLMPAWNFPGEEGTYKQVVAFTNCEEVKLYINGNYVGSRGYECPRYGATKSWMDGREKRGRLTTNDLHLAWDVVYEPGVLRAEGYIGGKLAAVSEAVTAGKAVMLHVQADTVEAAAGNLVQVELCAEDGDGRFVSDACPEISCTIDGPAELVGMDAGDLKDLSLYGNASRRMFNGRLLAVVRVLKEGSISLKFEGGDGLYAVCEIQGT